MNARFAVAMLLLSCMCACATQTTIESSWADPTFARAPFERIAVVALFDTAAESREFEQNAAAALEQRGIETVEGHTLLDGDRMYEQDELRAMLADADVDGILIYRLIAVDERNVYRPPTPYLHVPRGLIPGDPFYWYYHPSFSYYWYWRSSLDVTRSPGYWEPHTFVVVESSLYDAEKDQLVWTAKSETLDDAAFHELSTSIAERITRELVALEMVGGRERTAAR